MHFLRRKLDRRTMLRGVGAAIALPFLDAMVPAGCTVRDDGANGDGGPTTGTGTTWSLGRSGPPSRLVVVTVPNGFVKSAWIPAAEGTAFALPPHLQSLAPRRNDYTLVTGLSNVLDSGEGAFHTRAIASHLTGSPVSRIARSGDISVDQLAASVLGTDTPLPSLELGTEPVNSVALNCDGAWDCQWGHNIAWAGPQRPVPKDADPQSVFARLFGAGDVAATAQVASQRQSLLDFAADDARRLGNTLGAGDRARLDEYLTAVRAVERSVSRGHAAPPGATAPAAGLDVAGRLQAMFELTALALQADSTRVVTLMHGHALYGYGYPFLGIDPSLGGHHTLSHQDGNAAKTAAQLTIGTWEVEQFAAFVTRLAAIDDGGTSLLGRTVVLFTSELADGQDHVSTEIPVLLAGGANGAFRTGFHKRFTDGTQLANLYKTLLHGLGVGIDRVGAHGDSILGDLLA